MDSQFNFEIGNNSKSVTMRTHHGIIAEAQRPGLVRAAVIGSKSRPNLKHLDARTEALSLSQRRC